VRRSRRGALEPRDQRAAESGRGPHPDWQQLVGHARKKAFCSKALASHARSLNRRGCKLRRPDSNPNVVCGRSFAAFVAGIEDTARLDEQQFDLFGCVGLVLNAFRNDEHLSG